MRLTSARDRPPGLSLRQPNNTNIPLLAGDATKALGDDLDAFLLGNVSVAVAWFCPRRSSVHPVRVSPESRNPICIPGTGSAQTCKTTPSRTMLGCVWQVRAYTARR